MVAVCDGEKRNASLQLNQRYGGLVLNIARASQCFSNIARTKFVSFFFFSFNGRYCIFLLKNSPICVSTLVAYVFIPLRYFIWISLIILGV